MKVGSELWRTIRYRQWLLFAIVFALLSLAAIALPPTPYLPRHVQPLPVLSRLVLFAIGLSTLTLSASVSFYFVDSWRANRPAANKAAIRIWLGFETLVGVPFALACIPVGFACLWVVFAR